MTCIFRTTRRALTVFGVLGVLIAVPAMAETTVTDATGRTVTIRDTSRIVSVGGAVTEILWALGQSQNIVGVDSTSLFPMPAVRQKPGVGYMRQLSAEGVLGLNPSVVIAIAGAGPKETINVLEKANVPLVVVPDPYSEAGIIEKINLIAKATGATERGQCLAAQVRSDLDALAGIRAKIAAKKRVLFMLSFVNGRAMAAGTGTAADGIIRMAGGVNVFGDFEAYKQINDEAVIAARPDVIVSIQRGGNAGDLDAATVFAHPAFAATPAAAGKAFVSMDGLYLLGFGPRTARAARDLAQAFYPDLKGPPLPSEQANGKGACAE